MIQQMGTAGNLILIIIMIWGMISALFVAGFVLVYVFGKDKIHSYSGYTGNIYSDEGEHTQVRLEIDLLADPKERIRIQLEDTHPECTYIFLATYLSDDEAKELVYVLQRHLYS
jgi:hypothetical protein